MLSDFKYKFQLKPIYEIAVRPNSSSNCRITKDVIITINYNPTYKRTQINALLNPKRKRIILEVERKSEILKFNFQLYNILKKCF
jgi:hypothetical protein